METFEEYHNYSQNLLLMQHDVSEIIKHSLTRGEVREDFIIDYLCKSIQGCREHIKRGFIDLGKGEQSGQADILLINKFSETIDFGRGNVIVNPSDCLMIIEVKSTLTGTYLNEFNNEADTIKRLNPNIICGILAYKADLEKETIMNRFGFDYNKETQIYFDAEKEPLPIWYPNIDFILLLDKLEGIEGNEIGEMQGPNQIYLYKSKESPRYFLGTYNPAARNLVGLVRSLLMT